ncbi:MAG: hypothetical protein R6V05_12390 [Candidatus Brocadiia bacterium]
MNCREACRRIVLRLWGDEPEDAALDAHLRECEDCGQRLRSYRAVGRRVRTLEADEFPAEAEEALGEALDRAVEMGPDPESNPASPDPERPAGQKAAIAVVAIVLILGVTLAILMLSLEKRDLPPPVGRLTGQWGKLYVEVGAPSGWRELGDEEPLRPGTVLRTQFDAATRIRSGPVEWVLGGGSTIELVAAGQARLVQGHIAARVVEPGTGPLALRTPQGMVRSEDGAVVAEVSRFEAVQVGCTAGEASVLEDTRLKPGQRALLIDAELREPVRQGRTSEMTHWMRALGQEGHPSLERRQLASVPLLRETPALPEHVAVSQMDIRVILVGGLAVVRVETVLHNSGREAWSGVLDPAPMVLPVALAHTTAPVELPPGEQARCATASLHVTRSREGACSVGLSPQAWTDREIGRMGITLDARASEGFALVSCPTHGYRETGVTAKRWSWQGEGVNSGRPVVFEYVPAKGERADVVGVGGPGSRWLVGAWRPPPVPGRWFARRQGAVFAFDVNADAGAGGRCFAHEVADRLLRGLPRRGRLAVAAWDGEARIYPVLLDQLGVRAVEGALAALWAVEKTGVSAPDEFLREITGATSSAEREHVLVCVVGRDAPSEESNAGEALQEGNARLVVVQAGADRPGNGWRRLCKQNRGMCMAVPASMSPRLGAADALWDLRRAPLTEAVMNLPAGVKGRLLPAAATASGRPVVALVRLADGQEDQGTADMTARVGRTGLAGRMSLSEPPYVLDGPLGRQMAEELHALAEPGGM